MQPKPNQPITKEQLIGMWLDEKGSISLSEQIAIGFAYDKLSAYLQTKEEIAKVANCNGKAVEIGVSEK